MSNPEMVVGSIRDDWYILKRFSQGVPIIGELNPEEEDQLKEELKRTIKVRFVKEDTSGLLIANAGLILAKKIAPTNTRIVNNFMYAFY